MTGQFARIASRTPAYHRHQFNSQWPGHYLTGRVPPAPVRRKTDLELLDDAICELHKQYGE